MEQWKVAKQHIRESCNLIHETLLLNIEKKRVYEHQEFLQSQMDYLAQVRDKFAETATSLQSTMDDIHQIFAEDSEEVQSEWYYFTKEWDDEVKAALHHAWKKSLHELRRALQGDSKTDVSPLVSCDAVQR